MEVKSKDRISNNNRPWQGTVLGIFNLVGLIFMGLGLLMTIFLIFGGTWLSAYLSQAEAVSQMYGIFTWGMTGIIISMLLFIIPFGILQYFVTKGVFAGKRWAAIFSIVVAALWLLTFLSPQYLIIVPGAFLYLLLGGFMLYLGIMCVKHPFYKK